MRRILFNQRDNVVVGIVIAWMPAPAWSEPIRAFPEGAVIGGKPLHELVADEMTSRTSWPGAPHLNSGGPVYFADGFSNGTSRQTIPADTGIFVILFGSGEWDSPDECLCEDPNWTPLSDSISRLNSRLESGHDDRMWLDDIPIDFDWVAARNDAKFEVLVAPGTTGPCIEPNGDSPIERKAAFSAFYAYIPFLEPGEHVLEYFSPGVGIRAREFIVLDGLIGDLDRSGAIGAADIDLLSTNIREGSVDLVFDRDRNGTVSSDDRTKWFADAGISLGDIDLNGTVDFADFLVLSGAFGGEGGWADGDIDGNGTIAFPDFLSLSANFGTNNEAATVPEPAGIGLAMFGVLGIIGARRQRR